MDHLGQIGMKKLADDRIDLLLLHYDQKRFFPLPQWLADMDAEFCNIEPMACEDGIEWLCGPHKVCFSFILSFSIFFLPFDYLLFNELLIFYFYILLFISDFILFY